MFSASHSDAEKHLVFRDYLRNLPEADLDYESLKRKLASKCRNDRLSYTESKPEIVGGIFIAIMPAADSD